MPVSISIRTGVTTPSDTVTVTGRIRPGLDVPTAPLDTPGWSVYVPGGSIKKNRPATSLSKYPTSFPSESLTWIVA
jgi:hypothetical protein